MLQSVLVSIIIPTYKRSVHLKRAIDCSLSQSHRNIEVIVIDDNNDNDEFQQATDRLATQYLPLSNFRYVKHGVNRNGAAARNTGIKKSSGEYVVFLDDDDIISENFVEKQLEKLTESDDRWGGSVCYHYRKYKDSIYKAVKVAEKASGNYLIDFLSGVTSIPTSSWLLKKEVFLHVGYFDESFVRHQDLEFLVRFFQKYKFYVTPLFLMCMSIDGFRNYPSAEMAKDVKKKLLNKYDDILKRLDKSDQKKIMCSQWFEVMSYYLRERKMKGAYDIYVKHIKPNDSNDRSIVAKSLYFIVLSFFPKFKLLSIWLLGKFAFQGKRLD